MRITLDTTYLLPVIGVAIKGLPQDALIKLIQAGHGIVISEVSIFELAAKAGKLIASESLTAGKASKGMNALIHDERTERISVYHSPQLSTAFRLRRLMNDFIDCSILATAMHYSDMLVTEDGLVHRLVEKPEFLGLVESINPEFRVCRISGVL